MNNLKLTLFTLLLIITMSSTLFAREFVCVNKDKVNIRSGPGTKYAKRWLVYKYSPLEVLSRKGKWLKIKDFQGDKGWIYNSLTTKNKCVVSTRQQTNIRIGPNINQKKKFIVTKNYSFRVVKTFQNKAGQFWLKVKDKAGDSGWILAKLLWGQY